MRYCIQIKKKIPRDFFVKKILKKKLGQIHTHTQTHTGFLASWGLKTCLYAKKSKFHLSQWFLYEGPKIKYIFFINILSINIESL